MGSRRKCVYMAIGMATGTLDTTSVLSPAPMIVKAPVSGSTVTSKHGIAARILKAPPVPGRAPGRGALEGQPDGRGPLRRVMTPDASRFGPF